MFLAISMYADMESSFDTKFPGIWLATSLESVYIATFMVPVPLLFSPLRWLLRIPWRYWWLGIRSRQRRLSSCPSGSVEHCPPHIQLRPRTHPHKFSRGSTQPRPLPSGSGVRSSAMNSVIAWLLIALAGIMLMVKPLSSTAHFVSRPEMSGLCRIRRNGCVVGTVIGCVWKYGQRCWFWSVHLLPGCSGDPVAFFRVRVALPMGSLRSFYHANPSGRWEL